MKVLITLFFISIAFTAASQTAGEHLTKARRLHNQGLIFQTVGAGIGTAFVAAAINETGFEQTRQTYYTLAALSYSGVVIGSVLHMAAWQHIGKAGEKLAPASKGIGLSYKF